MLTRECIKNMNKGGRSRKRHVCFCFNKNKDKRKYSKWFASRKYKETRFLVKWRCLK